MFGTLTALTLGFLISHVPSSVEAWRNFDIIMDNVTCDVYTTRVKKLDCVLSKTPKNVTDLSLQLILAEDTYDLDVHAKLDFYTDKTRMNILDVNLNSCEFLQGGGKGNFMQIIFNILRDSKLSNAPNKCPVKKDKEYYLRNFHFDPEQFPPYTPPMKFHCAVEFYKNSELLVRFELNGESLMKTKAARAKKAQHK